MEVFPGKEAFHLFKSHPELCLREERNVSSRMRHFHGEFSVEPPRIVEAVC
jgi:hypothetical protein